MTVDRVRCALLRVLTVVVILLTPLPAWTFTVDVSFSSPTNVTGLWWVPAESGWGVALTQQGSIVFVTIFTYDSANNPMWYVASRCELAGDRCSDNLLRVRGGAPLTTPFDSAAVATSTVGTVTLVFTDVNNGSMNFTIDGVSGSKRISRQIWGSPPPPSGGNLPSALFVDVFDAVQHYLAGGWRNRGINVRNTPSSSHGCIYFSSSADRSALESTVASAGGRITLSTPTEWCAQIGNESLCLKLFGGAVLLSDETSGGITITEVYMPGLAADRLTKISYASDLRYAKLGSEWRDGSLAPGATNCNLGGQPSPLRESINGNWSGYSANYSPSSQVVSLAPSTMSCSGQTCTVTGDLGATFALSSTTLWRTASGATRLAGATVSEDSALASVFLCRAATVDETRPYENCTFFTFKRL